MLDFNQSISRLISELVLSLEEFKSIDVSRLAVSATYCKSRSRAGLLAYLLPLRYRDGSPVTKKERWGKTYHYGVSPVHHEGRELLYIIYFMLPRFLKLSYREKLDTVIHELYHISPDFNGDLRRLKGRSHLHGNSLKEYDRHIRTLTDRFLKEKADSEALLVLKNPWKEFQSFHIKEPRPKLIHVEDNSRG